MISVFIILFLAMNTITAISCIILVMIWHAFGNSLLIYPEDSAISPMLTFSNYVSCHYFESSEYSDM